MPSTDLVVLLGELVVPLGRGKHAEHVVGLRESRGITAALRKGQSLLRDRTSLWQTLPTQDEREVGGDLRAQLRRPMGLQQVGGALQVRLGDHPVTEPVVDLGELVLDHGQVQRVGGWIAAAACS